MRKLLTAIVLGGLLGGCGSVHLGMMTSGAPSSLLKTSDGTEIVMGACSPAISSTCERISKTNDSKDEEAWMYVVKMNVRSGWGIPYGEASVPVYVLGPVEKCQRMALKAKKLPEDRGALCEGPFYFKRD